ncbi:hypothetical protein BCR33DRAFT_763679 [Rhizoclosmatium globosum]|uniref:Glycosyl transferase CAP10 domain-containing protein n=1 Tax=Rhizoclosmatium globosum TaxID=329046 RepID=A0A1Y2CNJ8_9FUNG|nr:hypothetical protein BCR33DRAFT_763679 [Rhizoclosmatium globosum]|eukprot:ORY48547.1 hypothetical protein BCR33DRAFT_763679 [Rhizoclosmatium globosum]
MCFSGVRQKRVLLLLLLAATLSTLLFFTPKQTIDRPRVSSGLGLSPEVLAEWLLLNGNKCDADITVYDQIARDLAPWKAKGYIDSKELASDKLDLAKDKIVEYNNGQFSNYPKEAEELFDGIAPLLKKANTKQFLFIINGFDEPRIVKADPGYKSPYKDTNDVFKMSDCYRTHYDSVLPNGQNLFSGNKTIRSLHGFFMKPDTFGTLNADIPIFSQAKHNCNLDILIPLKYHIEVAHDGVNDVIPWSEKLPAFFWRGSTTGGSYRVGDPWPKYHRTRLIDWAQQYELKHPGSTFDGGDPRHVNWPSKSDRLKIDVGFCWLAQHDSDTGSEIQFKYGLKHSLNFEETQRYKYLLVVDGNTWPSRLQAYLYTLEYLQTFTIGD